MKKVTVLIMCMILLLFVFVGCKMENIDLNGNNTQNSIGDIPEETEEDKFVIQYTLSSEELDENFGIQNAIDFGIGTITKNEIFEQTEQIKKCIIDGIDYTYKNSSCTFKNGENKEYGSFYSIYDVYTSNCGIVHYLRGTDTISYYVNLTVDAGKEATDSPLSDEQAKLIADSFLGKFVDPEVLNGYKCTIERDGTFPYSITYTKYIDGYLTDEYLWVTLNGKGEVSGYDGRNYNKYSKLASEINKDILDAAKKKLEEKISSCGFYKYECSGKPIVTTNADGDIYLGMSFSYSVFKESHESMSEILLLIK